MSLILDGSAGVTFPSGSGTQAAQSKVLQVVQGSLAGTISTTSTSFVTSGLTASITPLFSTSKILVMVTCVNCFMNTANQTEEITVYRNSTNLAVGGSGITQSLGVIDAGSSTIQATVSFSIVDSPATTSSTTYTVYYGVTGGQGYINTYGQTSYIQLMEIAQ